MHGCERCFKTGGVIFLALGILYLGQDLAWWGFWTLNWWTALFLVIGGAHLASSTCKDCQVARSGKKK
tara:strand:+ start:18873 stop:19076 length:204 start_codon:yes stop_codon:yes gene_type:complete